MADAGSVEGHYESAGLGERILFALQEAGVDLDYLTLETLAPADQLHGRGLQATIEHAGMLDFTSDMHVLDIGCGIGGPARYLASKFGCKVTGIDLIEEFVEAAQMLTGMMGLGDLVRFEQGDVLELPYEDGIFDVVWCQNVTMNIEDRTGLYGQVSRVLKPGGIFTFAESTSGPGGDPHFPLPWAREPSQSHLVTGDELLSLLEMAGFAVIEMDNDTEITLEFIRQNGNPSATGTGGSLNQTLALGSDMPTRAANAGRSLAEDRTIRVRTHYSHQMTAAARAIAAMKFLMLRSKRVAIRRQSLRRQNMRSMMLRCL